MSDNRRTPPAGARPRGAMGSPGGGIPGDKPSDFGATMRRLLRYLRPRRVQIALVFVLAALSTVFMVVSPKILGDMTSAVFEGISARLQQVPGAGIDFALLGRTAVLLVVLYLISAGFAYLQQYLMAGVAQHTVYDLRRDVSDKLSRLPLRFYDGKTHGEILSRMTNDVDNIATTLSQTITQLITSVVTIVGIAIMMLTINPFLTLVTILVLPVSIVVVRLIVPHSQKQFAAQWKHLGELNGHIEEMYGGHTIIKAYRREDATIDQFRALNGKLYTASWKAQFFSSIIFPIMTFLTNVGYVVVAVAGGIMMARGVIRIGDIQAFIQYARQFSQPIMQTANIVNVIQSTLASAERVFELLDEEQEVPDAQEHAARTIARGEVRFDAVSFRYKAEVPLIEDMDINVQPGQTVAIVGPTGAGKTTLVNLLMRFYDVNGGSIRVDGVDIRELPRGTLRRAFGMVLQDTWLFNDTIRANIAYGQDGATDADVERAATAAQADHFIRTLPLGYETVLNEEASNVSQGERQLLTIARAILADPLLLILDEATSSVDTRTELRIQQAMRTLMSGRTSFVIAHRLSTIRDADNILVMRDGAVIETGNHLQLLEQRGFYYELYQSQFAATAPIAPAASG